MADSDDEPMLLADLPVAPASASGGPGGEEIQPYRVLARKYRPRTFSELLGQDAMVRTLSNAIARERIPHALIMTGVRGVGKTSTARLVAKALNCVGSDGTGGPTIDPCGVCEPCRAIAEGRHIDVVEIDAASNNGIDNVREITDAVRYAAVSARFKIYIVDEVHMMSKPAFNAMLKTLEEPPAHVKFLFATTEIEKVPVTVLSRCMRFDLKRIPADTLASHFADVAAREGVEAEPEALALIARAAEGSARDGLSLLDTAIAHASGPVTADQVRDMLGMADRGAVRDLFGRVLAGDAPAVLAEVRRQHELGVDPHALIKGLMEVVHAVAGRAAGGRPDPAASAEEREAVEAWAERLGAGVVHRLWQLLARGLAEVAASPMPLEAAEMALLRVTHAATLPDPGELARKLVGGEVVANQTVVPANAGTSTSKSESAQRFPADMPALVAALESAGHHRVAHQLHECVGVTRYAPPELALRPVKALGPDFVRDVSSALAALTGAKWRVLLSDDEAEPAAPSLFQQEQAVEAATREAVLAEPAVAALRDAFPQAELLGYTLPEAQGGPT